MLPRTRTIHTKGTEAPAKADESTGFEQAALCALRTDSLFHHQTNKFVGGNEDGRTNVAERAMNSVSRKMEVVANLAILVVAVLVIVVGVKRFLLPGHAGPPETGQVAPGATVFVPGVDWRKNRDNLVLALSTKCHFCTESAPFYQRLVKETEGDMSPRLVGLFPEQTNNGDQYLHRVGVNLPEIRQSSFEKLGIMGTPTLLLINQDGIVQRVWVGKLTPEKETEVLNQINKRHP
jgi:hypothetical protein